jgi:hypothetical protein
MLHDQALPFYLWAEAFITTLYIQNMSPHKYLGRKTLEEELTGSRPDVEKLCIFGCSTLCHVPSEKRTKLDSTTEKGMLVGYLEVTKAYRIYIPTLRRDVIFEEGIDFRRSLDLRSSHSCRVMFRGHNLRCRVH